MTTVLFVVTAADRWTLNDGTVHPSGFWGEELAMPHKIFTEAGWDIIIATPGGVRPTLDRLSMGRTAAGRPAKIRGQNPFSSEQLAERIVADVGVTR